MDKSKVEAIGDLPKNSTPFYVDTGSFSHPQHQTDPYYVLEFNNGWNDYGYSTNFLLSFYMNGIKEEIGVTKITNGEKGVSKSIPTNFNELTAEFCSLGQSYEFYEKLKYVSKDSFESVLYALKDSAFYSEIHEKFEHNEIFKTSLIRNDEAEQLLRSVKYKIYNFDLNNLYSFTYTFLPKYTVSVRGNASSLV